MSEQSEGLLKTDVLGRVTVPKERREEMLEAFEAGSLRGAEFARTHGIPVKTFTNWIQKQRRARGDHENEETRQKLRRGKRRIKGQNPRSPQSKSLMNFIEVDMSKADSQSPSLEVVLPSGAKVLVNHESQMPP